MKQLENFKACTCRSLCAAHIVLIICKDRTNNFVQLMTLALSILVNHTIYVYVLNTAIHVHVHVHTICEPFVHVFVYIHVNACSLQFHTI